MTITTDLFDMKSIIEEKKQLKANIAGKLEGMFDQLEEQFGCKTLKQAKAKIKKLSDELDEKMEQLESGLEDLDEKYDWDM